ncbi:sensor histidine kinase [Nocardioides caldifontis]|uniref:sensor histidine kinase n=1 Tax=Nocardioides caldifontis TaxID=2588938 RepID=UPI0011E04511|nr:HAMP domain-containing sensor histidine kinase [Nocardioides caldifontis]
MTRTTPATGTTTGTTTGATVGTTGTTTATTAEPREAGHSGALRAFRWSVRARITATVGLCVALALAGAGLLVYLLGLERVHDTVRTATAQEIAELEAFEEEGVDPASGGAFTSIERLVEEFLLRNVPAPSELMAGYWGGDFETRSASSRGELVDDHGFVSAVRSRLESGGSATVGTQWGEVYLEVLPLQDAQRTGAFVVAFFVDDERGPLHDTLRSYAIGATLAWLVVTGVAGWQAGRLLAPLRSLRRTAEEISETDLSLRIEETGDDDLTELTRTVNAMLGRLERAFQGQRAFLDDAGHELRTPLTILRGHLELVDPGDPEDVERTRDLLVDEVDRMARLVEDMILLTKAERPGFVTPDLVVVDQLVADVLGKTRGLADRRWRVEAHAGGAAWLDEQRITQALLQLADNAVKHTSPEDEVALGAEDAGAHVRLWVRDTGPGVPDAEKETIFARFARGADEGGTEGVGLGLSIVAAIAAAHGGSVHVEDAAPRGARFVLTLPRERKEVAWPAS